MAHGASPERPQAIVLESHSIEITPPPNLSLHHSQEHQHEVTNVTDSVPGLFLRNVEHEHELDAPVNVDKTQDVDKSQYVDLNNDSV
jgi:hypothetical protein